MNSYVPGKKVQEILGVHQRTLYQWDKKNKIKTIRTPGGKRLYNLKDFLDKLENQKKGIYMVNNQDINKKILKKSNIIYARVSSISQKNDLERQIEVLTEAYPNYTLIKDIGSGMNLNRRGLRKIIDQAIDGKINEVIIVHKDRLCRFGYKLIEDLIKKYSQGKIIILKKKEKMEPRDELVEDVLQIMNIFVARMNGMRKYKKKIKKIEKEV